MEQKYNMLRRKSIVWALCALFAITFFESRTTRAQSTLFNIPSTDVVAKKKTYLEFDFVSHLESHQDGGFQTYVPRAVFGLGKGLEAGVNVTFTRDITFPSPTPNLYSRSVGASTRRTSPVT